MPTGDGVRIAAVGFITAKVPRGTTVSAPGAAREKTFRRETSLRVPVGDNLVAADMRSVMPAAMITLFGIGAELGLLIVLAGGLSAASSTVHTTAVAVVVVMALVLLGYSVVTTNTLFSAQQGSALAPESKTSYTL